jgi:hypothetical protein
VGAPSVLWTSSGGWAGNEERRTDEDEMVGDCSLFFAHMTCPRAKLWACCCKRLAWLTKATVQQRVFVL